MLLLTSFCWVMHLLESAFVLMHAIRIVVFWRSGIAQGAVLNILTWYQYSIRRLMISDDLLQVKILLVCKCRDSASTERHPMLSP